MSSTFHRQIPVLREKPANIRKLGDLSPHKSSQSGKNGSLSTPTPITLGHSKTDQLGAGTEKVIERQKKHCPVAALEHWLSAAGIRNKDAAAPVFRAINQWGHVSKTALSSRGVVQVLQRAAELAGFPADTFSGHSLRAGFVTDQLAKDIGEIKIMQMTGHKSVNTLRKYYRPNRRRSRVSAT